MQRYKTLLSKIDRICQLLQRDIKMKYQDPIILKSCLQYLTAFALYSYLPFITFATIMVIYYLLVQYIELKTKQLTLRWILNFLPDEFTEVILQWLNLEPQQKGMQGEIFRLKRKISSHLELHTQEEEKQMHVEQQSAIIVQKKYHKKPKLFKEDIPSSELNLQRLTNTGGISTGFPWQYMKIQNHHQDNKLYDRDQQYFSSMQQNSDVSTSSKFFNEESKEAPQTIVLKKSNNKIVPTIETVSNDKWEKLDQLYQRFKSHMPKVDGGRNPVEQVYKSIQVLRQLSVLQKNGQRILKVDDRFLIKLFLISTVALTAQTIISKRSRMLLMRVFVIMFYFSCATLSTGTLSVIIYKLIKKQKDKKKSKIYVDQNKELELGHRDSE